MLWANCPATKKQDQWRYLRWIVLVNELVAAFVSVPLKVAVPVVENVPGVGLDVAVRG
jgi:hypothetical protein